MGWKFQITANAFCPTGEGGGRDNSCSAYGPGNRAESKGSGKKQEKRLSIDRMASKGLQRIIDDEEFFGFEDFLDEDESVKDMSREEMMDLANRMEALVGERASIISKNRSQDVMKEVWPAIVRAEKKIKDWKTVYRIEPQ